MPSIHVHVCVLCSFHQDVRVNILAGEEATMRAQLTAGYNDADYTIVVPIFMSVHFFHYFY